MSVNAAWQGRRYKTQEYKAYEQELLLRLKNMKIPDGPLHIEIEFGVSNLAMDFDNPVKPFVDCLQKRYGFNDRRIHSAAVRKVKVDKGVEYIDFKIRRTCNRRYKLASKYPFSS